jgi:PEP-CTERM motif
MRSGLVALAVAAVALPTVASAQVTPVTLSDGNSTALVDLNSSAGMYQWTVNGLNNLNQQWFWFRAGSGPQAPINSISSAVYSQSAANTLDTTYANASYSVEISYLLSGGAVGSQTADIAEGVTIHNLTASPLSFSFYQYSDFNLLDTPGGDSVVMDGSSAYQSKGDTSIAEGIINPTASYYEANYTGGTSSTLYKLNNVNDLALGDVGSAGPGDVTWAFQWDFTIPANGTQIISKDKELDIYVVPEPATVALVALGFTVILLRRRRAQV